MLQLKDGPTTLHFVYRRRATPLVLTVGLVVVCILFQVWSLDGFQGLASGLYGLKYYQ